MLASPTLQKHAISSMMGFCSAFARYGHTWAMATLACTRGGKSTAAQTWAATEGVRTGPYQLRNACFDRQEKGLNLGKRKTYVYIVVPPQVLLKSLDTTGMP